MRVVIFSNANGWHERKLIAALRSIGAEPAVVSLADCVFSPSGQFGGVRIPGFPDELPSAAFVRGIAAGSFEQVTLRLGFLHALAQMSVRVVNSAKVIERTVDKSMTSHLLIRNSVATVPAWTCESREYALELIRSSIRLKRKLVLKPLFGSRGRGLELIQAESDLPDEQAVNGVYYLQEFVPSDDSYWRDWRIMVVGNDAICAMERRSDSWVTNRARGAQCLPAKLPDEALQLAVQAAAAVEADYAGVDVIHTRGAGWQVIEINGVPAWQGLQEVSDTDIARAFARLVTGTS
ncbi:MAG: hypothetical protein OXI60_05730 [Acidiferrobacterales bacterium]|nr:hypothetical protein [Acidiferrobacterales bacterium]